MFIWLVLLTGLCRTVQRFKEIPGPEFPSNNIMTSLHMMSNPNVNLIGEQRGVPW